jgi:hypothetical protein
VPSATYKRRSRSTRSGLELPRTDGRTLAARRFRALYLAFENELGRREVSTRRRQRCRAHPPLEPHLAGLLEHRGAVGLEALAKQDVGLCEDLA